MNKDGDIIVIEDDADDRAMFEEMFKALDIKNEVKFFTDGEAALNYLAKPGIEPFIILSDINLPKLNGFELRERVFTNKELSRKCIPYIFFTTSATKESVINAYAFSAQGFFIKPTSYYQLQDDIRTILEYWRRCFSPSDFSIEKSSL
jgi:CheY-like chemotaxis protein